MYGKRIQKIGLDGGFSCPNRDGTLGHGGCSYCSVASFAPSYQRETPELREQIEKGISFFGSKYGTDSYLAYFQSYTSSHGQIHRLEQAYEIALGHPSILGLNLGTRPDCLEPAVVDLLDKLRSKWGKPITIEIGIESTLDRTLDRIGRGHSFADSCSAIEHLVSHSFDVNGHLILGLPGESRNELLAHAPRLNQLPLSGLKIHHLQVLKGTRLAREVSPRDFLGFSQEEYLDLLMDFIPRLRPNLVLERFINEAPVDQVITPRWGGVMNYAFGAKVVAGLEARGLYQGVWHES
ncbi:MAG: TIGR01212 family radical SAM protein [Spirochaetales bacterium]|nr:TIGR01212 family radical SAM protein [Spirochaetales bacterium]